MTHQLRLLALLAAGLLTTGILGFGFLPLSYQSDDERPPLRMAHGYSEIALREPTKLSELRAQYAERMREYAKKLSDQATILSKDTEPAGAEYTRKEFSIKWQYKEPLGSTMFVAYIQEAVGDPDQQATYYLNLETRMFGYFSGKARVKQIKDWMVGLDRLVLEWNKDINKLIAQ